MAFISNEIRHPEGINTSNGIARRTVRSETAEDHKMSHDSLLGRLAHSTTGVYNHG